MKKCILILLDGLGDRSFSVLDNRTPLQAASTPFLDSLAEMGANGLYHASEFGEPLPSEIAHFLIFGYDRHNFPGRGVIEAFGAGIDIADNDVAVLARFVSAFEEDGFMKLGSLRPVFSEHECREINNMIGPFSHGGVDIVYHPVSGLSGIVVLKGDVSAAVTDTDPMIEGNFLPEIKPLYGIEEEASKTAEALHEFQKYNYSLLEKSELNKRRCDSGLDRINFLVTQRSGMMKTVEPFFERYGMRGVSISSGIVYQGLASYLGMENIMIKAKGPGDDLLLKLNLAYGLLDDFDYMHIHTKAPDEAAHKKDPVLKKEVIESLDKSLAEVLEPFLERDDVLIAVTADHSTPSEGPLIHSGEPVPLLFCGKGIRRDYIKQFDEVSAGGGALGCMRGRELMRMILNSTDRARLAGINETGRSSYFWPGFYSGFKAPLREDDS